MTVDRLERLLIVSQALDAATFLLFFALFGSVVDIRQVERGSLTLLVFSTFGVGGFLMLKLGAPMAIAAWPWHPEQYRRWIVVARDLLMVAAILSGALGLVFNVVALAQVGSILW